MFHIDRNRVMSETKGEVSKSSSMDSFGRPITAAPVIFDPFLHLTNNYSHLFVPKIPEPEK